MLDNMRNPEKCGTQLLFKTLILQKFESVKSSKDKEKPQQHNNNKILMVNKRKKSNKIIGKSNKKRSWQKWKKR